MNGFRETASWTDERTDRRDFLGLQRLFRETKNNKPSRGVSRLPTVFLQRKLSKYRLKRPKYIVLGNPKKPEKTPKNGQNRF